MDTESTVSVSKARRILGDLAKHLSDTQVIEIINALRLLAREQLVYNSSKRGTNSNDRQSSNSDAQESTELY